MKIGFTLPQMGPIAQESQEVARFAREAERLGADNHPDRARHLVVGQEDMIVDIALRPLAQQRWAAACPTRPRPRNPVGPWA